MFCWCPQCGQFSFADEYTEPAHDVKSPSKADRYKATAADGDAGAADDRDMDRQAERDAREMALPVEVILDDTAHAQTQTQPAQQTESERESKGDDRDRPVGADLESALVSRCSVVFFVVNGKAVVALIGL